MAKKELGGSLINLEKTLATDKARVKLKAFSVQLSFVVLCSRGCRKIK